MTAIYKPTNARGFAYEEGGIWYFVSGTSEPMFNATIRVLRSDLVLIPEVR